MWCSDGHKPFLDGYDFFDLCDGYYLVLYNSKDLTKIGAVKIGDKIAMYAEITIKQITRSEFETHKVFGLPVLPVLGPKELKNYTRIPGKSVRINDDSIARLF